MEHFKVAPPAHRIYCHGLDRRIPPLSSKENRYALTAVCMITGFTFCIPIKSKKVENVMKAYTDNICCVFGPSKKMLTEYGKEFKNKLWTDVFKRMHTEHRTSPILLSPMQWKDRRLSQILKSNNWKAAPERPSMG